MENFHAAALEIGKWALLIVPSAIVCCAFARSFEGRDPARFFRLGKRKPIQPFKNIRHYDQM